MSEMIFQMATIFSLLVIRRSIWPMCAQTMNTQYSRAIIHAKSTNHKKNCQNEFCAMHTVHMKRNFRAGDDPDPNPLCGPHFLCHHPHHWSRWQHPGYICGEYFDRFHHLTT